MHPFLIHPASFRDPAGFVFEHGGTYYRQVNTSYSDHYDLLMSSGLYQQLARIGILISHKEVSDIANQSDKAHKILLPEQLRVISYASEWCFEQLQDAAIITLEIALAAITKGMILKDATPNNIQFVNGRAVWIDTLSFERYNASEPWFAYRQFCSCFLFPLYLAHYTALPVNKLLQSWPEGVPADVTWSLLPANSRFSLGTWMNIYLQKQFGKSGKKTRTTTFSEQKMRRLLHYLLDQVKKMRRKKLTDTWQRYYDEGTEKNYLDRKKELFLSIITNMRTCSVLDMGANTGAFSLLLAERGFEVIAIDNDEASIGHLYNLTKTKDKIKLMPLIVDLMHPTPASGFRNAEQLAFFQRIRTELVVALALIHHLVFVKNCPLPLLADYFSGLGRLLIMEWIPLEDEKVKQMISGRTYGLHAYNQQLFESSFERHFNISKKMPIEGSLRWIYLMEKR